MNKIASLKPGDDGVLIEALINHVVSGKTNGAHRSTYLSMTLQDDTDLLMLSYGMLVKNKYKL